MISTFQFASIFIYVVANKQDCLFRQCVHFFLVGVSRTKWCVSVRLCSDGLALTDGSSLTHTAPAQLSDCLRNLAIVRLNFPHQCNCTLRSSHHGGAMQRLFGCEMR